MFLQSNTGRHFTEIPSNEALVNVFGIIDELNSLQRVSAFTRPRERYYLGITIYNLFYRLARPHYKRDQTYDRPYVCLARGTQFYSGKYIQDRPHLAGLIGKGKLTHRLAKRISKYLVRNGICYEEIGYPSSRIEVIQTEEGHYLHRYVVEPLQGQMTRLLLIPAAGWDLPADVHGRVHDKLIALMASFEEKDSCPAIHRNKYVNEAGDTVIDTYEMAPVYIDLMNRINAYMREKLPVDYHSLMSYRWIAGKNMHEHMRLYAPLTSIGREARQLIFNKLGFVEHDLSACAANIVYMMETGEMFSSDEFGSDVYSDIIYTLMCEKFSMFGQRKPVCIPRGWVRPYSDEIKYMRPLVKELLTIAQGTSYTSEGQVVARIAQLFIENGFILNIRAVRRKTKDWHKQNPNCTRDDLRREYVAYKKEAKKQQLENWEAYKQKYGLSPKAKTPVFIDPRELFLLLYRNPRYAPLAKYLFNGSFRITTNVETFANLMLHEYAMERGIYFHSLHDAIYALPEHMEELKEKQLEFLRQSCELKREEIRLAEVWNPILNSIEKTQWKPKYFSMKAYRKDVDANFAHLALECHQRDIRGISKGHSERAIAFLEKTMNDVRNQFEVLFVKINQAEGYSLSSLSSLLRFQIVSSFCLCEDNPSAPLFLKHYRTTIGEVLVGPEYIPPILDPYVPMIGSEKDEKF